MSLSSVSCCTHQFLQVIIASDVSGVEEYLRNRSSSGIMNSIVTTLWVRFKIDVSERYVLFSQCVLRFFAMWTSRDGIYHHCTFVRHVYKEKQLYKNKDGKQVNVAWWLKRGNQGRNWTPKS